MIKLPRLFLIYTGLGDRCQNDMILMNALLGEDSSP